MSEWFSLYTLVAFILGVMLAGTVKAFTGSLRQKAGA